MGCVPSAPQHEAPASKASQQVTSSPATQADTIPAKQAPAAASGEENATKSKSTRARRLSVIQNGAGQGPPGDGIKAGPPAANAPEGQPISKTRARRLSYVSNNMAQSQAPFSPGAPPTGEPEEEYEEEEEEAAQVEVSPPIEQPSRALKVHVACMSRAGREPGFKKTNQDNCFAFEKYMTEDQSLFGAMDGHGPQGHLVSGYVKQHLPIVLVNHMTAEADPRKALSNGFNEVHKSLGQSRIDCEFSGSTAVVAYLKGTHLTTSWVGDSRGVLGHMDANGQLQAVDLTNDHKPTIPEEKARILKSNGRVERLVDEVGAPMGPHRVWLQYAWIPGLAMSRALGDMLAHQVGVTSEPEHSVRDLSPSDKFMVLASDGVWEFISSQEAVDIVNKYDSIEEACRQLVDEAYQRWLTEEEGVVDDITAVLVRFIHE